MSVEVYLAYLLACVVIATVPGPMVTLIVANSLAHGMRAGLENVAGGQLGLAVIIAVLMVGLTSLVESMGWWFDWVRLVGAAYLVWLGWRLVRAPALPEQPGGAPVPRGGFVLQGLLVTLSNPKTLLFFGAFIPQFVDTAGDHLQQVAVLGMTAMAIAVLSDAAYAVLAARAGTMMSRRHGRLISRVSGGFLIGGGLWLAFTRVR